MIENIFDSHAHYDDPRFDEDRESVMQQLSARGVALVLNCGANLTTSAESVKLAAQYDFVYAAVGIHPADAAECDETAIQTLKQLATAPKVVAIGETGLDYHYDNLDKRKQKEAFLAQLDLAKMLSLPVIIHSRDAILDTLHCIENYQGPGVFHCFSESVEVAEVLIKKGFYIGLGGVLTFSNAKKTVAAARSIPLERILVETDCPYLAPVPYRGQRNDSGLLSYVLEKLAEIRGMTPSQVTEITNQNAKDLFHIHS